MNKETIVKIMAVALVLFVLGTCINGCKHKQQNYNSSLGDAVEAQYGSSNYPFDSGTEKTIVQTQWGVLPASVGGVYPSPVIKKKLQDTFGIVHNTVILSRFPYADTYYKPFTKGKIVLTVNWLNPYEGGKPSPVPYCTDTAAYRSKWKQLLAYTSAGVLWYNVERQPLNGIYYTGTVDQYLTLLKIATQECHAVGAKVADGGLTVGLGDIMTYEFYREVDSDFAEEFAQIVMNDEDYANLQTQRKSAQYQNAFKDGTDYYNILPTIGIDYATMQWYEPCQMANGATEYNSTRMKGFEKVYAWLKNETGLPVAVTAAGQYVSENKITNRFVKRVKKLGVPYCFFLNGDAEKTVAYTDSAGAFNNLGVNLLNQIK